VSRPTGTFHIGGTSKVDLASWLPTDADAIESFVFEAPTTEWI